MFLFDNIESQKVKNIDTFVPVAAAPLGSTNVEMALSRSSLNMISVLLRRGCGLR